jgi:hypothetical protein
MAMGLHELSRSRSARRLGALAAAGITAICIPLTASASPHGDSPDARSAAVAAVTYGGVTGQGWPVVVELSRNKRRVVRAVVGIALRCTAGGFAFYSDPYGNLAVNRKRKFSASFGPDTERHDDGTTSDFEGSMSGRLNRARSKISGTWRFKVTDYDNAGAVVDVCDSGSVRWTAKQ